MEEHAIKYEQSYQEFRKELDYELNRAAEGFVRIGFLLKKARDTDILKDSPYASYTEFAEAEFGLDKSQVSRFIAINDRFSRHGNSEELQDRFKGFGSTKLTLMLSLPDAVNEELTPDFSKQEIQTIKEEVEEEQRITPLEVMVEETTDATKEMDTLGQVVYELFKKEAELFARISDNHFFEVDPRDEDISEIMAPSGSRLYMVRVPGKGKFILNLHEGGITLTDLRSNEKTEVSLEELSEAIHALYGINRREAPEESSEELWEHIYDAPFPKKAEVAPVQPGKSTQPDKKEEKKPRKESKVVPSKKQEKKETGKKEEKTDEKEKEAVTPIETKEQTRAEKNEQKAASESAKTEPEPIFADEETEKNFRIQPAERTIRHLKDLLDDYVEEVGDKIRLRTNAVRVEVLMPFWEAEAVYNAIRYIEEREEKE